MHIAYAHGSGTIRRMKATTYEHAAVGARIRALREAKGIDQIELGRRAGVSQTTMFKYEQGKHLPESPTFLRIADELDTSIRYLLTGREEPVHRIERDLPASLSAFLAAVRVTDSERAVLLARAANDGSVDYGQILTDLRTPEHKRTAEPPALDVALPEGMTTMPKTKRKR